MEVDIKWKNVTYASHCSTRLLFFFLFFPRPIPHMHYTFIYCRNTFENIPTIIKGTARESDLYSRLFSRKFPDLRHDKLPWKNGLNESASLFSDISVKIEDRPTKREPNQDNTLSSGNQGQITQTSRMETFTAHEQVVNRLVSF